MVQGTIINNLKIALDLVWFNTVDITTRNYRFVSLNVTVTRKFYKRKMRAKLVVMS